MLDVFRLIMQETVGAQPVRRFLEREPKLALRVLTREHGALHEVVAQTIREVIAEAYPPRTARELVDRVDDAVHVASALQWVTIAIDEAPDAEHIVEILRRLLAT